MVPDHLTCVMCCCGGLNFLGGLGGQPVLGLEPNDLISTTFTVSPSTSNHLRFPNKVQSIKLSCSKYSCFLNKKPMLTRLWRARHSSKFHGTPKRSQRGAVWLTAHRHRASAPAHSVGLAGAAAGAPRACACAPAAPAPCAPSPGGVSGRPASLGRIAAPRAPAAPALPVRTALDHRALAPCRRRVEAARAHELQQCGQRPGVGSGRGEPSPEGTLGNKQGPTAGGGRLCRTPLHARDT